MKAVLEVGEMCLNSDTNQTFVGTSDGYIDVSDAVAVQKLVQELEATRKKAAEYLMEFRGARQLAKQLDEEASELDKEANATKAMLLRAVGAGRTLTRSTPGNLAWLAAEKTILEIDTELKNESH